MKRSINWSDVQHLRSTKIHRNEHNPSCHYLFSHDCLDAGAGVLLMPIGSLSLLDMKCSERIPEAPRLHAVVIGSELILANSHAYAFVSRSREDSRPCIPRLPLRLVPVVGLISLSVLLSALSGRLRNSDGFCGRLNCKAYHRVLLYRKESTLVCVII